MLYIDTSVLVSAFTSEIHTTAVQRRLAHADARDLTISDWVVTEYSSALARKLR